MNTEKSTGSIGDLTKEEELFLVSIIRNSRIEEEDRRYRLYLFWFSVLIKRIQEPNNGLYPIMSKSMICLQDEIGIYDLYRMNVKGIFSVLHGIKKEEIVPIICTTLKGLEEYVTNHIQNRNTEREMLLKLETIRKASVNICQKISKERIHTIMPGKKEIHSSIDTHWWTDDELNKIADRRRYDAHIYASCPKAIGLYLCGIENIGIQIRHTELNVGGHWVALCTVLSFDKDGKLNSCKIHTCDSMGHELSQKHCKDIESGIKEAFVRQMNSEFVCDFISHSNKLHSNQKQCDGYTCGDRSLVTSHALYEVLSKNSNASESEIEKKIRSINELENPLELRKANVDRYNGKMEKDIDDIKAVQNKLESLIQLRQITGTGNSCGNSFF